MTFFDYLKNIFLVLILLQITPYFLTNIYHHWQHYFEQRASVGVVEFNGTLSDSTHYREQLYNFFTSHDIKAVLLKMDCSGSASGTGQIIFNEIQQLKKEYPKPVIALVENVCTSGGYMIACAADHIIAPEMALVGSIGVIMSDIFQLKDCIEQFKIKYIGLKAGAHKGATDPFTNMTQADQLLLQEVLNSVYGTFTALVAQARNISLANSQEWAEGKIFSGKQAKALRLVDENGSWSNAVALIKNKALIEGAIDWIYAPAEPGFLKSLLCSKNSSFIATLSSLVEYYHKPTKVM